MSEVSLRLTHLRAEYSRAAFDMSDAHPDPLEQFSRWFEQARLAGAVEPNAMTLATATQNGAPSARMVLLKGADDRGFSFHTNLGSRKGEELMANPFAALVFWWPEVERQVRIEGHVEQLPAEDAAEYFRSRPRNSQLGAWASPQSRVVPDREFLDSRLAELESRFEADTVPVPDHWAGFVVRPTEYEFWQGRASRLHDRIRYRPAESGWLRERLAP